MSRKPWIILKDDILRVFQDFFSLSFQNVTINASMNETYICLILRELMPRARDYQPISLILWLCKIVARGFIREVEKGATKTITENQLAFIKNR